MKRIAARARGLIILILFFGFCTAVFFWDYGNNSGDWVAHPANKNVYLEGIPTTDGKVFSSDGVPLLDLSDLDGIYADDPTTRLSTLHAVGDISGNIKTGVLNTLRSDLLGYNKITGTYSAFDLGSTINLTIDSTVSNTALSALGQYNGAVGVYNYKTGEILCMVSSPTYDPYNVPDLTTDKYEGVYLNRVIDGLYAPGSIMKIVTSQAAIETIPDIYEQTFQCDGGTTIDGEWVACSGNHGTVDFKQASAQSCNSAYALIAQQLSDETLSQYMDKTGISDSYDISGVNTAKGRFNLDDISASELAWAAIGQSTTMVNPMQYLIYMGAIAGDGVAANPYYVQSITGNLGVGTYWQSTSHITGLVEEDTAIKLQSLMRNNAIVSYNDASFEGMSLCAKTGTAELDNANPHSWFVGFLDNEQTPLAFVVIVENGGADNASTAIPVARSVLQAAVATFEQ